MEQNPSKNIVDLRNRKPLAANKPRLLAAHEENDKNLPAKIEKKEDNFIEKLPEKDKSLLFKVSNQEPKENEPTENLNKTKSEEPKTEIIEYENELFSWVAPEYVHYEKDKKVWMRAIFGIAAIFFVISFFFLKSYPAAVLTIVASITVYVLAFRKPRTISFGLTHEGIYAGSKFTPYESISSFWIFYHPPDIKEIVFRSKKVVLPFIYFNLGDADPNEIRKVLIQFLKEEEEKISAVDELSRRIGF